MKSILPEKRIKKIQIIFYRLYFFILAGSVLTLGVYLFNNITSQESVLWSVYLKLITIFLITYTWYIFIMMFLDDLRRPKQYKYNNEKIYVLLPCFNEEPHLLRRSIESIVRANGNTEIVIINDGSTNGIEREFSDLKRKYRGRITIFSYIDNRGKRHALHYGVKHLTPPTKRNTEFFVTIDSDTVIDKNSLVNLVKLLKNPKVGAVTGEIKLLNEKENLLTRMISAYYWTGLNVYRKAQSAIGIVSCCSGCLAGYKAEIMHHVIDDFANQTFMGEPCTYSEDRHLTNLVLKRNFKVLYTPEAFCWTETPATFIKFMRQQVRWKRGCIRESAYTLGFAWKNNKILFVEIILWDLGSIFITFAIRILSLAVIIMHPLEFLVFILPMWMLYTFMRYIYVVLYAPNKIPGLILFTFFHEFILYWQNLYALFTVKNKSWVTRGNEI